MNDVVICRNCSSEEYDDEIFCTNCGIDLNDDETIKEGVSSR